MNLPAISTRFQTAGLLWLLTASFLIAPVWRAAGQSKPDAATRVLLTVGGHDFDAAPFFNMFDNLPGVTYTRASLPDAADLLKPGLADDYDVIVMYDMVPAITADQGAAFRRLLERGIGVVSLHHNLGAHREWSEFTRMIGGAYIFESRRIANRTYEKSSYAHGQDIRVRIADANHPITQGLTDFQIHDETYAQCYVSSDAHVLLSTDHPLSNTELAWTHRYGNSPVCYLQLGHDAQAWQNPMYVKLLGNAIRWAGSQEGESAGDT